ncbi:hypothetical protein YTPLAS73_05690 [Nitrosarchaeum sp.]|nr:hypothetical protein YTPLAS73_05690 [Nitrosarchaeum sp.]
MDIRNNDLVNYDDVFNFINIGKPEWENSIDNDKIKIKTNEHTVKFEFLEQLTKKYNFRIAEVTFSDYHGIVLLLEKQQID